MSKFISDSSCLSATRPHSIQLGNGQFLATWVASCNRSLPVFIMLFCRENLLQSRQRKSQTRKFMSPGGLI